MVEPSVLNIIGAAYLCIVLSQCVDIMCSQHPRRWQMPCRKDLVYSQQ